MLLGVVFKTLNAPRKQRGTVEQNTHTKPDMRKIACAGVHAPLPPHTPPFDPVSRHVTVKIARVLNGALKREGALALDATNCNRIYVCVSMFCRFVRDRFITSGGLLFVVVC